MEARNYTPLPPIDGAGGNKDLTLSVSEINTVPVAEVIKNLRIALNNLSLLQDLNKEEAEDLLNFICTCGFRSRQKNETEVFNLLIEVKFLEIYRKVLKNHFYEICETKKSQLYEKVKKLISLVWNTSDKSKILCDYFIETGLHKDYITYLKTDYFSNSKIDDVMFSYMCKAFISTLHNTLQKCSAAREGLRAAGAVDLFQQFRSSSNQMVSCLAIMAQAYVVTEEENDRLNSDRSLFEYMMSVLDSAANGESLHGASFCIEEILDAINKLASNDNNKKLIIDVGGLSYYVAFLQQKYDCSLEATAMAAHGIWILGFKCKDEIIKYDGCLAALRNLLTHSNQNITREAAGALWILEEKSALSRNNTSRVDCKTDQHVFISYQWDSKKTVYKVRDHLKRAGIKTWIDGDDMSGSLLEAMAIAVEQASVVIICMSQKYKDSPNCRTEAEYTFRLRKPVIPLRLQTNYQPDGWLGILVGSKLYFDVSVPAKYDDSVRNLLKEIDRIKQTGPSDSDESIAADNRKSHSTHEKSNPVRGWTRNDIDDWAARNRLDNLKHIFSKFDGNMLIEYAQMKEEAPDAFYMLLNSKNIDIYDMLLLKIALKEIL